jgi:hypothetical protein
MPSLLSYPPVFLAALLTLVPFFLAAFWTRSLQMVKQLPRLAAIG